MSHIAISAEKVGKRYRIGAAGVDRTLVGSLGNWMAERRSRLSRGVEAKQEQTQFRALSDISFQVCSGEAVGLIGHNGAGKSTLLKILSRITEPSEGRIRYKGRVGSLLEVGTGFHPELSGRDNILLGGAVLGMRREDVRGKMSQIVDFAGVEKFIDTPVKRYSSGMYLRLAFAVAAHLDTDILLLDEVLAVGDMEFQKKCLQRIDNLRDEGRTIVFVSHNLTAVRSLCNRAILLENGRVADDGPVDRVIERYSQASANSWGSGRYREWPTRERGGAVQMIRASVRPLEGDADAPIEISQSFIVDWQYRVPDGQVVSPSLTCRDDRGLLLFDQGDWDNPEPVGPGTFRTTCTIPGGILNNRTYLFSLHFKIRDAQVVDFFNVLSLELQDGMDGRHGWYGKWDGVLRMRLHWKNELLEPLDPYRNADP